MYACRSVSVACRPPRSAGDAAKLSQFIGQFSWVTGDPIGLKGLCTDSIQKKEMTLKRVYDDEEDEENRVNHEYTKYFYSSPEETNAASNNPYPAMFFNVFYSSYFRFIYLGNFECLNVLCYFASCCCYFVFAYIFTAVHSFGL